MTSKAVICYLADARSEHTRRWALAFASRDYGVVILSFRDALIDGAQVVNLRSSTRLGTVGYLATLPRIFSALNEIRPAIIHAHYASSYGLLASLAHRHPLVVSCWGSDIFEFPHRSALHHATLSWTLSGADTILATGQALAAETNKYTNKKVTITPFGVDTEIFKPSIERGPRSPTIGIIKPLIDRYYGFTTLVDAFRLIVSRRPDARLVIVGDGPDRSIIESRIAQLNLSESVEILPQVPHRDVPNIMSGFDVMVLPSNAESFGVVALEAAACEVPVVASNVGGLPEVVIEGRTGYLVPPRDPVELAERVIRLVESSDLRRTFGRQGRIMVLERYAWPTCVDRMESVYRDLLWRQRLM